MSFIETAIRRMRESASQPVSAVPAPVEATPIVPGAGESGAKLRVLSELLPASNRRVLALDIPALRASGLLPPEAYERQTARQFRRIKLPLVQRAVGNAEDSTADAHLIMVASAMPGEGKTFTSVNLAFNLARERDVDVVLVDADVAKPHLSHAFNASNEPGLVDALTDPQRPLSSLIMATSVERLHFLPAGRFEEDSATELLSSVRMKELMADLATYRGSVIVVFDSAPLLLTTESEVLATLVGQVVLVVRAGVTLRSVVAEAMTRIPEDKPMGVILNQANVRPSDGYSYYAGYGGYGNYGVYGSATDDGRKAVASDPAR